MLGPQTDDAAITNALDNVIPPLLAWLDEQIAGKKFFVSDRLSIADIAIASPFVNFNHGGESVDAATYPNLAAFLDRMHSRPTFAALITEEKALFKRS